MTASESHLTPIDNADTVRMTKLYCGDFPDAPSCCDSCHDDIANWHGGEYMSFDMGGGVFALVCCRVYTWLEDEALTVDKSNGAHDDGGTMRP